jgi:hypothetical protein
MLIWYRWIGAKAHVWLMLLNVVQRYVLVCDVDHTHVKFCLFLALGKMDFVVIYDILDDLLRFPPY